MLMHVYVEVLTLQFGSRGHPVSARLGVIYHCELSKEDLTVCTVVCYPAVIEQVLTEDNQRSRSSSIQLPLKPLQPLHPQQKATNTVSDHQVLMYHCIAREEIKF